MVALEMDSFHQQKRRIIQDVLTERLLNLDLTDVEFTGRVNRLNELLNNAINNILCQKVERICKHHVVMLDCYFDAFLESNKLINLRNLNYYQKLQIQRRRMNQNCG